MRFESRRIPSNMRHRTYSGDSVSNFIAKLSGNLVRCMRRVWRSPMNTWPHLYPSTTGGMRRAIASRRRMASLVRSGCVHYGRPGRQGDQRLGASPHHIGVRLIKLCGGGGHADHTPNRSMGAASPDHAVLMPPAGVVPRQGAAAQRDGALFGRRRPVPLLVGSSYGRQAVGYDTNAHLDAVVVQQHIQYGTDGWYRTAHVG